MHMNELRAEIDTISGVMTAVREEIHDLENELSELFDRNSSETDKNKIYRELGIQEDKYWQLRDRRDKYIAWAN